MKTIFIASSKPGNARPDYFRALAKSFVSEGYTVFFFIDGTPKQLPEDKGVTYLSWPNKRPTGIQDFIFLAKLILRKKPSILISSFGAVTVMNLCGFAFNVKNRWNYVLSVSELFSGNDAISFTSKFKKWRKKRIYNLATILIPNSEGTKIDIFNYYKIKNKKTIVLPNLIKDSQISYVTLQERQNNLLMVGNLIKLKGQVHIIKQMIPVVSKYPNFKLVLIGTGKDLNKLQKQVKAYALNNYITFLGKIPYSDMGNYFASSLLHIAASENEAFGFVNIEALREGTPIISTKTAGALSIINEGKNGRFIDITEENFLIKAIDEIMNNWHMYSNNALKIFKQKYKLETNISKHRDELLKHNL